MRKSSDTFIIILYHHPDTVTFCIWRWSKSFSIESMCADVLWQCAVLRLTSLSQSHHSISRAGLSPHTSYQSDFDRHMFLLFLAGLLRKPNKNGNNDWVNTNAHTQTWPWRSPVVNNTHKHKHLFHQSGLDHLWLGHLEETLKDLKRLMNQGTCCLYTISINRQ